MPRHTRARPHQAFLAGLGKATGAGPFLARDARPAMLVRSYQTRPAPHIGRRRASMCNRPLVTAQLPALITFFLPHLTGNVSPLPFAIKSGRCSPRCCKPAARCTLPGLHAASVVCTAARQRAQSPHARANSYRPLFTAHSTCLRAPLALGGVHCAQCARCPCSSECTTQPPMAPFQHCAGFSLAGQPHHEFAQFYP
jgi:hypothetical protein